MSIVVGIENAPHSEVAMKRAIQLAEALDMELHVVHVKHIPAALYMSAPVPAVDFAEIEDEGAKATWALVEPALAGSSAKVTRETLTGNPADSLVEYAAKVKRRDDHYRQPWHEQLQVAHSGIYLAPGPAPSPVRRSHRQELTLGVHIAKS